MLYQKGQLYVGLLHEADSIMLSGWHQCDNQSGVTGN